VSDGLKWKPNLSPAPVKKGEGQYLLEAMRILYQAGYYYDKTITDKTGNIAYLYKKQKVILCAKEYIYGDIVSAHKKLVDFCADQHISLIMYIGDARKFYRFDPMEIKKAGKLNWRGTYEFYNFPVKLGDLFESKVPEETVQKVREGRL